MGYGTPVWFVIFLGYPHPSNSRHHCLPSPTSSLEMAAANTDLTKLAFPSPPQQSRDTLPLQPTSLPLNGKSQSDEVSSKERDSSHRHKPGHEEAPKGWRPSKNAVKTNQKGQKGVVDLSATRNRVHTRMHANMRRAG